MTVVEVAEPPKALLEDCVEPAESGKVIALLRENRPDDAAVEYARYVLDVRDGFQVCNGRFKALREYYAGMRNHLEGNDK